METYDKDVLKELVSSYREVMKIEEKAIDETRDLDPDEHNEEVYDASIAVVEAKDEIRDYVERFLIDVKHTRTSYSELALEIFNNESFN